MRERDTTARGAEFDRSVAGEVATVLTVMYGFKRYKHGIKKPQCNFFAIKGLFSLALKQSYSCSSRVILGSTVSSLAISRWVVILLTTCMVSTCFRQLKH